MTTTAPAPDRPRPRSATWGLSAAGLRTVVVLELRQRVRATRWIVVLCVWTALIALFSVLGMVALHDVDGLTFSAIVLLVLSLGLLVAPALAAASVNGDRAAGTLATLQTTLLTAAEIAVGKVLAAWTVALVFLACALPFLVVAAVLGDVSAPRLLRTIAMIVLVQGVVCLVGVAASTLAARAALSAVLTYLAVALVCFGGPTLFGLASPFVVTQERVTVRQEAPAFTRYESDFWTSPQAAALDERYGATAQGVPADDADWDAYYVEQERLRMAYLAAFPGERCTETTAVRERYHGERIAWLLAASPYVLVADVGTAPDPDAALSTGFDPLQLIQLGARAAQVSATGPIDECWSDPTYTGAPDTDGSLPVWPLGLLLQLLLGAGCLLLAVRRLATPQRRLPKGTRVA